MKHFTLTCSVGITLAMLLHASYIHAASTDDLPRIEQKLVQPPFFPVHDQTAGTPQKIVAVKMVIEEKEIEIEPGVFIWAFTFNGSVPGPIIVANEGDYIELSLINPKTNQLPHNIDFHAATGAMGGGELTLVSPGQQTVLRWKATKPGAFIYHCAPGGNMVPWHVVHGMNGAVVILPKDGIKDGQGNPIKYDRAYYIGEQDFYLPKDKNGQYKRYPNPIASFSDDIEVMRGLVPTHIIFGAAKGALTGINALTANVGETVMVVHSQANRQSYPHLIGGHGNYVWERGNLADAPATNLESWVIAAGSAGVMMYEFRQPGKYAYLSHNLIEAFLLGAVAQFEVKGTWDNDLMQQMQKPVEIQ